MVVVLAGAPAYCRALARGRRDKFGTESSCHHETNPARDKDSCNGNDLLFGTPLCYMGAAAVVASFKLCGALKLKMMKGQVGLKKLKEQQGEGGSFA